MAKLVEYQDNLFWVTERIKLLEKAALLDLDPGMFSRQVILDLEAAEQGLQAIRTRLLNSAHTLQKPENLRALMLANQRMAVAAEGLGAKGLIPPDQGEMSAFNHIREAREIQEMLVNFEKKAGAGGDQVTPAEFAFLMQEEASEAAPL